VTQENKACNTGSLLIREKPLQTLLLRRFILEKTIRFKDKRKEPDDRIIGLAIKGGF